MEQVACLVAVVHLGMEHTVLVEDLKESLVVGMGDIVLVHKVAGRVARSLLA